MCFSAGASLGAGIMLSVAGVAAVRKSTSPSQCFFAAIPFLFSIQQFTEGVLWLSLTYPSLHRLQPYASHLFLFIAQVVWPAYVPFSIRWLEKRKEGDFRLYLLCISGLIVAVYEGACLLVFPVGARIEDHHIHYFQSYPASVFGIVSILYIAATVFPPFFSGHRKMWMLGSSILVSSLVTYIFYKDQFISVWCFFAALISAVIYLIVVEMARPGNSLTKQEESVLV